MSFRIDYLGNFILVQSAQTPDSDTIADLIKKFPNCGIYFKRTSTYVRHLEKSDASPQHLAGPVAPEQFLYTENGVHYWLNFNAGYSFGIFTDQARNRAHIREMNLAGKTVLNTFAYTCAFSVCAALAGAITTSIDLSKKYLEWGKENFRVNHLDDSKHDFIFGDVLEWLARFARKKRQWDMIILDPPTFSTSKSGNFQAARDYPKLLALARSCLASDGKIFACINTHDVSISEFQELTGITTIESSPNEPHLKFGWTN